MTKSLATRPTQRAVARPLRVLIPLIQEDLKSAASAGLAHYIAAGNKLIEAKAQVSLGSWGRWLNTHFSLHQSTARLYMRAAEAAAERVDDVTSRTSPRSLLDITGIREQRQQRRQERRVQTHPFREALNDVDVEAVSQDRQTRTDEVELHRALALEMIDIGFKALATRLHPDRPGGSRAAMARANRVREELKQVAATRRFV